MHRNVVCLQEPSRAFFCFGVFAMAVCLFPSSVHRTHPQNHTHSHTQPHMLRPNYSHQCTRTHTQFLLSFREPPYSDFLSLVCVLLSRAGSSPSPSETGMGQASPEQPMRTQKGRGVWVEHQCHSSRNLEHQCDSSCKVGALAVTCLPGRGP